MDRFSYLFARNLVEKSLQGLGAIQGAPCEVQSVIPIIQNGKTIGNTITLKWRDTDNEVHTKSFAVMNGVDGTGGSSGPQSVVISDINYLKKIADYLYEIEFSALDYDNAKDQFENRYEPEPAFAMGACTSMRQKDNNAPIDGYYRNYDWYYNNQSEFVVRTPKINGKHASIGIAQGPSSLTEEFVSTREQEEAQKILPFMLLDGINDAGLACNINVVPTDCGITTGTTPAADNKESICTIMLVRYILDNFSTVDEALSYLEDYVSIQAPMLGESSLETHFMLADATSTKILEFINNTIVISDVSGAPFQADDPVMPVYNRPLMTNFFVNNSIVEFNAEEYYHEVLLNSITPYSTGVERYNYLVNETSGLFTYHTISSPIELLSRVKFTKAYDIINHQYSEFTGHYSEEMGGDLVITDPPEKFATVMAAAIEEYETRDRNTAKTWQTVHSVVYDMKTFTLTLAIQEDYSKYQTFELINNTRGVPNGVASLDENGKVPVAQLPQVLRYYGPMTQTEYDALEEKDPTAIYLIT